MKEIIYTLFALFLTQTTVFSQQSRLYDTTFTVVTISPPQSFYLDSRMVSQISGRSRLTVPVQLPEGTVKWYYSFAAMESKNEPLEWVSLAGQLTKLVDRTGITATVISTVVKPIGTANCDIFVLNTEGVVQFDAKNDDKWSFDKNLSRQNITSGVVESYVSKPNLVIGLSNPSLKTGINIRIEATAVVGKLTPYYNANRQKTDSSNAVTWTGTQREACFKKFQSSFEGKLTPSVSEVSMCMLTKIMKEFKPEAFEAKTKGEQDVLLGWMKKDCFGETKNEALEKRMLELEETKLKINELEQKGDFTNMASVAERTALEFPTQEMQTRHLRGLLLSNQLSKARTLGEILAKNNKDDLAIQSNLAHVYLLSNLNKEAEKLYLKYQKAQFTEGGLTWEQAIGTDFEFFVKNKIYNSNYDNVKKKLKIK